MCIPYVVARTVSNLQNQGFEVFDNSPQLLKQGVPKNTRALTSSARRYRVKIYARNREVRLRFDFEKGFPLRGVSAVGGGEV